MKGLELSEKVKELVESIIGYPIEKEEEFTETITYHWLVFKGCSPFRISRNFSLSHGLELYGEGIIGPVHIIPDRVLMALNNDSKVYVYQCKECLRELKDQPVDLHGFPEYGTDTEKLEWCLKNLDRFRSPILHSSFIGKSIVIKYPYDDDHIKRVVYCTKPGSTHHLTEIIGKDNVNYEEVSTWKC